MSGPVRLIAVAGLVGLLAQPAFAFQESSEGGGAEKPAASAPAVEAPKSPEAVPPKGLNLKMPQMSIGEGTGTEVRIPGFGKVGVLPKLDFGLELLYGATEQQRGRPDDKSEPNDVQIRGTIKHRF
jgi:hypothetical protein